MCVIGVAPRVGLAPAFIDGFNYDGLPRRHSVVTGQTWIHWSDVHSRISSDSSLFTRNSD
jgi:hypothetical protein